MQLRSSGQYLMGNLVEVVQSGDDFILRMETLINKATSEIHIQSYIFEPDETGQRIMRVLIAASLRKVSVFILVDAYGSQNLSIHYRKEMEAAGIKIRRFGKFYSRGSFHFGRRLHCKVIVADGEIALVGGINISNKYTNQADSPAWLDFAVQVKGPVARRLLLVCRKRWMKIRFKSFPKKLRDGIETRVVQHPQGIQVKVSENDYINRKNEIAFTYRDKISSSQNSITIIGGYFLPGGKMRRILSQATDRGVAIKIIVSDKSDVKLVELARRYLYTWLLKHQIKIYEYLPSNVHGKVLICDNNFTSIGSYDLNNLSTYSNIELNLDIRDEIFAGKFLEKIDGIIEKNCRLVTTEDFRRRFGTFYHFLSWGAYQLVKTFFILSLLTAKKTE